MISVIIPAFNEEKALPATLRHLLGQSGDYEVFVVDGGSADATRDIAQTKPHVRLLTAPKGRASQMNAGARGDSAVPARRHASAGWCTGAAQSFGVRSRRSGRRVPAPVLRF